MGRVSESKKRPKNMEGGSEVRSKNMERGSENRERPRITYREVHRVRRRQAKHGERFQKSIGKLRSHIKRHSKPTQA